MADDFTAVERQLAAHTEFEALDEESKAALAALPPAERNVLFRDDTLVSPQVTAEVLARPLATLIRSYHLIRPALVAQVAYDETTATVRLGTDALNTVEVDGFDRQGRLAGDVRLTVRRGVERSEQSIAASDFDAAGLAQSIIDTLEA